MRTDYDVAIVGGGPAGSWSAYRLAASGARVVLIDGSHPREKPCGGGVTGRAFELIQSAISAASFPTIAVRTAAFTASGRSAPVMLPGNGSAGAALGIVARRDFDNALLTVAQQAGAAHLPARATSIERTAQGWSIAAGTVRVTSAWVIGADGATSLVRRRVVAPFPRAELSIATGYYVRGSTSGEIAIDFDDTPTGYVWSFPRADHFAVGACGQSNATSASAMLARAERWIDEHIRHGTARERYSWPIPSLGEGAIRSEKPAGEGWMLVGDAAGLVDPITREGIYFALLSADVAADSLGGPSPALRYAAWLRATVYPELIRAARLKARFFRPELLALLVRALGRSGRVREIMADLISGRQSYVGLRRRLLSTCELRLMIELFRL